MKNTSRKKSDSSEEDEENCESTSRFNFLRTVELIFICVSLGFLIWTYFTVPKAFRIYENSTSEGIHIKFKMFLHDEKENPNVAPKAGYDDDSVDNLSIAERIGIDRWKLNIPESTTSKSATTPEVINEESRFFPFYIYILLICNCTTIIIIVVVDLISHAFDEPINKIPMFMYLIIMFLLTLCNVIFGAVIFEHTQKPEAVCFAIVSGIAAAFFISDGVFLLNNEEIC